MKKEIAAEPAVAPVRARNAWTKEQLLKAVRYVRNRDALSFLLEDGKTYGFDEVDAILENYYKKGVK